MSGPTPTPSPGAAIRRLQSFNFSARYIRHQGFRARIDENVSPFEDAQFRVVSGLADSGGVSFESVNFPGRFLRHRNNEIWLDANDGSAGFRAAATWYRRAGFADSSWSSYESYNFPGQYMRHSGFLMILGTVSGSLQQADATFRELSHMTFQTSGFQVGSRWFIQRPGQVLKEHTLTAEYKFGEGFLLRGEYRRDYSNLPFFLTDLLGVLKKEQNTATIGLVWWWGRKKKRLVMNPRDT